MEIPDSVRALLWEYDTDTLTSAEILPDVVVERVMSRGGWDEMRWLLTNQDRRHLCHYLVRRGRRVLPPRELGFWALACGISDSESVGWIRDARARESAWRG